MARAGLSTELIVADAAQLVDRVGREGLTLAALARQRNVAQPSLYKHIDGLAQLHQLLAAGALQELGDAMRRASSGKSGSHALHAVSHSYRTWALAHPGQYSYVTPAPSPENDAVVAAAAEVLSVLNDVFSGYDLAGDMVNAIRFLRSALHGFVSLELGGGFGLDDPVDDSFRRLVAATDHALTTWNSPQRQNFTVA